MKPHLAFTLLLLMSPALGRAQPSIYATERSLTSSVLHAELVTIQTQGEGGERPDLQAGRIAGELFTGVGLGLATGYVVSLAGFATGDGFFNMFERGYWGLAVGHTVGSAAGVYLIGIIGDQTGSFPKTLLGSTAGMGAALLINLIGDEAYSFLLLPPIGATIAFNRTRRYDTDMGVGMQISLNRGRRIRPILTVLPQF